MNIGAGWSSLEARRAHNPKVTGSNPVPAILTPFLRRREGLEEMVVFISI